MISEEFLQLLLSVVEKCAALKNAYVQEKDLGIDYICIFSHSEQEYEEFLQNANRLGYVVDETQTGPVFKFTNSPSTIAGKPSVLKIRKPGATRPQRGDVDFNTNYSTFKAKYLGKKGFSLIQRKNFEMMELKDKNYDVLVYFSSIRPSKLIQKMS